MVKKVRLEGVDPEFKESALTYVQTDIRPSSRLNVALYNTFNTKDGRYRTDRIRAIGSAPNTLDSSLVEISRVQIEKYLATKGFFMAEVSADMKVERKQAEIVFTAQQGPEFKVRNIEYVIPDTAVKNLYLSNKDRFTNIHSGQRYDADSLVYEREQIFKMMRQNGYFDYLRQMVTFSLDSNHNNSVVDVRLNLANPPEKIAHQVYTLDNSLITIRNSDGLTPEPAPDTITVDSQFRFVDYSGKFDAKPIARYIFINKGEKYNILHEELTYDRLYDLNVFRNFKIVYAKSSDSTNRLFPIYDISPLKRMSNRIEGEYTFNSDRNGFNIGNTYTNRNLFGGAELLEIKAKYGVQFDSGREGNFLDKIFSRDLQLGVNLVIPKLLVPFRIPQMGRNGIPHTTLSTSLQLFNQREAFRSRVFINSITYDWVETKYKLHSLTPINIEFRKGELDQAFKEKLQRQGYELYVRTNDRRFFNLGSQYAYTLNALRLNTYGNFFYFRGSLDAAGNTLGLLDNLVHFKRDETGYRTVFGLPYQQYVKTEIDLRMYRSLGGERQLVARVNPGIGIPLGDNEQLTFEKNFYAGGSSGVRAWQARSLGPGNYNRASLGTGPIADTLRNNLRNLDQLGEVKFEANLEYRFKIAENFFNAKVKGATFTDFGNVWRLRESIENPGGQFRFGKLWQQTAVGAGLGLRFDLNYFVFRLDAGVKIKDPQFEGSDQWVIRHIFDKKDFKAEYLRTHRPDKYQFVQYNFGIGMPF